MKYSNDIQDFVNKPFFNQAAISPNGEKIFYLYSRTSPDQNHYEKHFGLYDIASESHLAVLDGARSVSSPKWSKEGRHLSFQEDGKLILLDVDTGEVVSTIGLENIGLESKITGHEWADDENSIWLVAEKDRADQARRHFPVGQFDRPSCIYNYNLQSGKILALASEKEGIVTDVFSTGNKLYYTWKENNIYDFPGTIKTIDLETGALSQLKTDREIAIIKIIGMAADSKLLFLGYGQYPSNACLTKEIYSLDIDSGKVERVLQPKHERGVGIETLQDGTDLLIKECQGVQTAIYSTGSDGKHVDFKLDKWISSLSVSQQGRAGFVMQDFNENPDVYYADRNDLDKPDKYKKINVFKNEKSNLKATLVEWTSRDDKRIEGVLVAPAGRPAEEGKPLVVITTGRSNAFPRAYLQGSDLLGGNDKFPYPVKMFAERGYYTFLANCRSDVYHEYEDMTHDSPLVMDGYCHNVMDGITHVISRYSDIDKDRIAVMGWSLGGYVAARLSSWPDNNIKTTVIGNAVTNLLSMYSCSNCFEFNAFMRGGYWESPDRLERYLNASPVNYIDNIKGSTFIQHGSLDPSMPVQQGREYYYALRLAGKNVEMTEFSNAGHVFDVPRDLGVASHEVLTWLERNL